MSGKTRFFFNKKHLSLRVSIFVSIIFIHMYTHVSILFMFEVMFNKISEYLCSSEKILKCFSDEF